MAKDEKTLMDMARRRNMPVPARIQNAPDLLPGLEYYMESFNRLTTSRSVGMGCVGPIPYAAISLYCKDEELDGEFRRDMFYHIERLDAAYMVWQTKKAKDEAPKETKA